MSETNNTDSLYKQVMDIIFSGALNTDESRVSFMRKIALSNPQLFIDTCADIGIFPTHQTTSWYSEAKAEYRNQKRVKAIKIVMGNTGLALVDAKKYVDQNFA